MKCRIRLVIQLHSDFHAGSGTGRGRTVDAQVLKDPNGCPYILGSSIKGLARYHAKDSVAAVFQEFGEELVEAAFGGKGRERGWFFFEDARLPPGTRVCPPMVVGRSARDRQSGTTRDKALFFNEVAAGTRFQAFVDTEVLPDDSRGLKAVLLVLLSLRRIEALGASRRRGLGRCSVELEVMEGPDCMRGAELPMRLSSPPELPGVDENEIGKTTALNWLERILQKVESHEASPGGTSPFAIPATVDQSMACLPLLAQAATPLVFAADQSVDNIIGSLDYVPGSTMRGAVAHWLLNHGAAADGEFFQRLIAREQLRFGPLYPLDSSWDAAKSQTMPVPVPLSFVQCKAEPGELRVERRTSRAHGVLDRLYHPDRDECGCGDALVPRGGWGNIYQPNDQQEHYELRLWESRRQTIQRTAIDSEVTHRARSNELFATESIRAGTWLAGYIWGPQWAIDLLATRLFDKMHTFRVGKSRTRGHGKLCVWSERQPAQAPNPFQERRDSCYPMIYREGQLAATPKDGFSLTCYSDLIAVDSLLMPLTRMTANDLWRLLPHPHGGPQQDAPFDTTLAYVRTVRVSGFNGQAQLPRMSDVALAAGSCWRFVWKSPDQKIRDEAWKLLVKAHQVGLGLRCGEGFGRVMLDLPMHGARLNQVQYGKMEDADRRIYASLAVSPHAASFPNAHVRSELASSGMAIGWLASDRRKAKEAAAECGAKLRATAARLLWQLGQTADANGQLQRTASELVNASDPAHPAPGGKRESTRQQLGDFLQGIVAKYTTYAHDDRKMAAWLQLTAEYLRRMADRSEKETN